MYCKEWCLVKRTNPELTIIPLRCKCWTCEECQPGRRLRLIAEGLQGFPNTFMTLTTWRRPGACPEAAARALVKAWRTVRQEYLKKHGKRSLPFLAVFEATTAGWPHLHIIARSKWIDQKWLSRRMDELIGAPIVDVRRIEKRARAVRYVTKYVGKEPHRFVGVKRYWRSLDYLLPSADHVEPEEGVIIPWRIVRENWITYAREQEPMWRESNFERHQVTLKQ